MHDKDGRERVSGCRRQRELGRRRFDEEAICARSVHVNPCRESVHTGVIANHGAIATLCLAVPEDAKIDALERSKRYSPDDGRGERRQEQQHKGDEE
jgi:hypothetical protein